MLDSHLSWHDATVESTRMLAATTTTTGAGAGAGAGADSRQQKQMQSQARPWHHVLPPTGVYLSTTAYTNKS